MVLLEQATATATHNVVMSTPPQDDSHAADAEQFARLYHEQKQQTEPAKHASKQPETALIEEQNQSQQTKASQKKGDQQDENASESATTAKSTTSTQTEVLQTAEPQPLAATNSIELIPSTNSVTHDTEHEQGLSTNQQNALDSTKTAPKLIDNSALPVGTQSKVSLNNDQLKPIDKIAPPTLAPAPQILHNHQQGDQQTASKQPQPNNAVDSFMHQLASQKSASTELTSADTKKAAPTSPELASNKAIPSQLALAKTQLTDTTQANVDAQKHALLKRLPPELQKQFNALTPNEQRALLQQLQQMEKAEKTPEQHNHLFVGKDTSQKSTTVKNAVLAAIQASLIDADQAKAQAKIKSVSVLGEQPALNQQNKTTTSGSSVVTSEKANARTANKIDTARNLASNPASSTEQITEQENSVKMVQKVMQTEAKPIDFTTVASKQIINTTNEMTSYLAANHLEVSVQHDLAKWHTSGLQEVQQLQAQTSHTQRVQLDAGVLQAINIIKNDAAQQLQQRVNLLMNLNMQEVEIRLDPPELGSMQIRVRTDAEQAHVNFMVQNQQAKEALEQSLPRLRELLAEQGLALGESQIQHGEQQGDQQDEQQTAQQQNSEQTAQSSESEQQGQIKTLKQEQGIDYYV